MKTIRALLILFLAIITMGCEADESIEWRQEFDAEGRVDKTFDPSGRPTRYAYETSKDGAVQKMTVTPPEGVELVYRFDDVQRLENMVDGEGEVAYGYDGRGHLESVQRKGQSNIKYTHDWAGRLETMSVGNFYKIQWEYDYLGRLKLMDTPAGIIKYEYQTGRNEVIRTLPNGVKTFWKRQMNGQLESITHGQFKNPKATSYLVLAQYTYQHGANGCISAIKESSSQGEVLKEYRYDTMGRLVQAMDSSGRLYGYEYDLVGNRTRATASGKPGQQCTYDWAGQLTTVNGKPCSYDANGNLTDIKLDGIPRQYRYHPDNRMAEAKVDGQTIQYRYDGHGRLVARKAIEGETRFIPDPLSPYWQPLVMEESGNSRTLIIWDGAVPLATISNGKTEWLLHDHLGSVRLATDAKGNVSRHTGYDPFGAIVGNNGTSLLSPGYAGMFHDTGLQLTLARSYACDVGSFFQADPQKRMPIGTQRNESLYTYCGGNPIQCMDRNGAEAESYDANKIWWDAFWRDVSEHLFDSTRAKDTLAMYSTSHLQNAHGSGWAAGLTATGLDIVGGYIPGEGGNRGQALASVGWSLALGLKGGVKPSSLFKALNTGGYTRTASSAIINSSQENYGDALLDVVSLGLSTYSQSFKIRSGQLNSGTHTIHSGQIEFDFVNPKIVQLAKKYDGMSSILSGVNDALGTYGAIGGTYKAFQKPHLVGVSPDGGALSPSNVGGVYLGGGSINGLGMLKGIRLDANGNLVLVGDAGGDIKLPPLRLDDVATIFRSFYIHGEGPWVTIDPDPENPDNAPMHIKHGKATDETYVGWVLYEADRLMKIYTQGVDNKTKEDVESSVPGYGDVLDTMYFGGGDPRKAQKEGNWERFWIVPSEANQFEGRRKELTLFDVPLKVNTQKMKWKGDELVDDLKGRSSPGATVFTKWFTEKYGDIAKEQFLLPPPETGITEPVPVFAELRRIALMTVVVEKLYNDGVPLPFWIREHEITQIPFEHTTPGLEVTKTKQEGNVVRTARIFGGVQLTPEKKVVKTFASAADVKKAPKAIRKKVDKEIKLATTLEQVLSDAALEPFPVLVPQKIKAGADTFTVAAMPGAETKALGPCRLEEVDIVVPLPGGGEIALTRNFNSFFDPKGPWGRGWALDLPRLEKVTVPVSRVDGKVSTTSGYELITPLNSFYARFLAGKPVMKFANPNQPSIDTSSHFAGMYVGDLKFLANPETDLIQLKDGRRWHFSERGDLIAVEDGAFATVYERGVDGKIKRIAGLHGGVLAAEIKMKYSVSGVLEKAVGNNLLQKDAESIVVDYFYASDDRLSDVESKAGHVEYGYEGSKVASVNWRGAGAKKAEKIAEFKYDAKGQLLSKLRGNQLVEHTIAMTEKGLVASSTLSGGGGGGSSGSIAPAETDSISYDKQMRPTEHVAANGTKTEWKYGAEGSVKSMTTAADGRQISVTKSANGRERVIEAQGEPEIRVCYDEGGRMVAVEEDGKELLSQEWRQDGQLHKVEAKDQTASLAYDDNAVLKTITLHPPVEGTRLSEWQETLVDRFGRPVEVKDCTGLDLQMGYDDDGKLQALIQNTSNGNLGFSIERDQDGRVERIASSWGVTDYAYSDSGELYLVETTRNQKKAAVELAAGRITKQTSYDGGTTEFKYKSRGRDKGLLQSIECPNHLKLSNMYDSKGRIKQVSVGNVREVSIEYDNEGRIVGYCYGEK